MFRISTAAATVAAFAMAATPAAAMDLPVNSGTNLQVQTGEPDDAAGWGRGRRHRGGIDAGDVIAGVLVIGAIAAIAGSSKSRDRDRYEERYPRNEPRYDPRNDDARYRTQRDDSRNYEQSSGIDRAVDMCIDQLERGRERVGSVDNASRTSDGWRVSGALENGPDWNCWIDNDGRIREVDLDSNYSYNDDESAIASAAASDRQLSDQAYANARQAIRNPDNASRVDSDLNDGPQPAYPGGPLPGEEGYAEAMGG